MGQSEIELRIARWSAWAPGVVTAQEWSSWCAGEAAIAGEGVPDVAWIPGMTRRRLGRFARMAMTAAHECRQGLRDVPVVFSSRHGDLGRTLELLDSLGAGEELSPTSFSLSVHNAVPGMESIVRGDRSPATAIAAGEESFGYGMVEAVAQLAGSERVLLVYADEPPPPVFRRFVEHEEAAHALAILFDRGTPARAWMSREPGDEPADTTPQSLAFMRFLLSGQRRCTWRGERCAWNWSRC